MQQSTKYKSSVGVRCDRRGDPGLGQELVLGCRWHWELQEKEQQRCHRSWSRHCTSWDQLCPPGLPSNTEPGICFNIFLHSRGDTQPWSRGKTKNVQMLLWTSVWILLLVLTATRNLHLGNRHTWICVCRKKRPVQSPTVFTSLLASVKLLWCYRWDSVTEVLALKPWKFGGFMDVLVKQLSMMANTFSPKQRVVIPVCSVHHAHGAVSLWWL